MLQAVRFFQDVGQALANLPLAPNPNSEKLQSQIGLDVRICKDCRHTLFSKSDFMRELKQRPPDQRSFENLTQFERGIRLLLPKFQRLLTTLQYVPTAMPKI